jgi:hypothetical protein
MLIWIIKNLVGTLSEEDRKKLYDLLGVVAKSAAAGAVQGMKQ